MRSSIADKYINENKTVEEAICRFVADLMRGDPSTLRAGYSRPNAIIAAADAFAWDRRDIEDAVANMTDNILTAEQAMGFPADTRINLLAEHKTPPHGPGQREYQRHVAIEWEGGVLWLNMFDFATGDYEGEQDNRHFCIDVRQFNSAGKVKGEGVFTMAHGVRGTIVNENDPEGDDKLPQGRKWSGGYVVCILTDPDGEETHTDDERK
jgi:hypothetical protein